MSRFWANWDPHTCAVHIMRKDTRVYYHPGNHAQVNGRCIGTFYLENPGSGMSSHGPSFSGWSPIVGVTGGPGDQTLQMIWDVWHCTQCLGKHVAQANEYIEVLNLYYLQSAASTSLLGTWTSSGGSSIYHPPVDPNSQFVVAGWGTVLNIDPIARTAIANIQAHGAHHPKAKFLTPALLSPHQQVHVIVHRSTTGAAIWPLTPYPLHPMGAANRGLKWFYIANVAASI